MHGLVLYRKTMVLYTEGERWSKSYLKKGSLYVYGPDKSTDIWTNDIWTAP